MFPQYLVIFYFFNFFSIILTLKRDSNFSAYKIRPNTTLVQRSVIEDIARRKGRTVDRRIVMKNVKLWHASMFCTLLVSAP